MKTTAIVHIGVDVSKKHLDLSLFDEGDARIPNDAKGLRNLVDRIGKLSGSVCVTCEATGGYENQLLNALLTAEVPAARLNPSQVRYFIRSQGVGAKNDRIDAHMLARFAKLRHDEGKLFLLSPDEHDRRELRDLLNRRSQLSEAILQERNRLDPAPEKVVAADIRSHIRFLERHLKKIELAIDEWLRSHPSFESFHERLSQVKGLGRVSVLTLIAFMPELGQVSAKRAAALVGVAPYERQSGESQQKARIGGGRSEVRKTLYMAALAAARSNPLLEEFYQRLVSGGKPKKVALIAVMRKLVVLANKVAADPEFTPV